MLHRAPEWLRRFPLVSSAIFSLGLGLGLGTSACTGSVTGGLGGSPGSGSGGNTTPGTTPGNMTPGGGSAPPAGGSSPGAAPTTAATATCTGEENPGPRRLRLLTRAEYAQTAVDLLGIALPAVDNLPVETVVDGFDNNARAAAVTSRHVDEYLSTAERLAVQAIATKKASLAACAGNPGCDRTFITTFGRRAFRRPLGPDEIERYAKLFDAGVTGGSFDKGMELVLRAMLSSPHFLYRSEMGEKAADGTYRLTSYEVATSLSYLLWGSTPDDLLLEAAKSGALDTAAGLEMQAKRLIADKRSRPAIAAFYRQWLGTDGLLFTNKDAAIYPTFSEGVRRAMLEEQDAFVNHVIFEGTGKLPELFTAKYVFANQALAQFYGLGAGAGAGAGMSKVDVPATGATRGGLLTLGAVVGMHAHANESSPVRRGLFVRSRLLCQTLPSPPANLDITPPGLDPTLTTRVRFDRHSSDPVCQGCHQLIDPLGYGFERYDGVGAYRETEAGVPVDDSGVLTGMENLNSTDKVSFKGPIALGALLAASPNAQACLARQLFRFARGGEDSTKDACAISKVQSAFRESGFDLQRLLLEVVRGKSFLTRS